jgi:hypothetical protein
MKLSFTNKRSTISILVSIIIALYVVFNLKFYQDPHRVISWDVTNYYSYLPATFIYGDPLLNFTKDNPQAWYDKFVPLTTPSGGKIIKMSMGLSFCYAPFFAVAHIVAKNTSHEADGYSAPYKLALILSSVFFFALGLFTLRKILLLYFPDKIVAISLLIIALGTNLFYYTAIRSAMSHSYNFALICLFIWTSIQWHKNPSWIKSVFIGLLLGLISLIRPTNILISLIFLLYQIHTFRDFRKRIVFFLQKFHWVLIMLFCFLLVWIPQLLYWKAVSGHYFYFSYQGESFFFNNPQIINTLFSYRNGWLVYTPLLSLSIIGLFFLRKKNQDFFFSINLYLILSIYTISSWWCWWYVGYGNRAFIDLYGVLAISLAALLFQLFQKKKWLKIVASVIITLFISLNLFQTYQYYKGYIQFDSMTKEAYWNIFLKADPKDSFWGLIEKPDYEKALKGVYEPLPPKEKTQND